jgi:hypothetical protein
MLLSVWDINGAGRIGARKTMLLILHASGLPVK